MLALLLATSLARGDERVADQRFVDRWFFTQYTGVSFSTVNHLSRTTDGSAVASADNSTASPSWAVGLGETYWPCDYFGLGFDAELFNLSFPQPGNPALDFSAFAIRLGPTARIAVPLRYLQPYVGIAPSMLGVSIRGSADKQTDKDLSGGFDASFNLVYLFGSNFYITRNLRAFIEYRFSMFDGGAFNRDSTLAKQQVLYQGVQTHLAVTGIAWSPEPFHAAPNRIKKYLWGVPIMAMAISMITMGIIGGEH